MALGFISFKAAAWHRVLLYFHLFLWNELMHLFGGSSCQSWTLSSLKNYSTSVNLGDLEWYSLGRRQGVEFGWHLHFLLCKVSRHLKCFAFCNTIAFQSTISPSQCNQTGGVLCLFSQLTDTAHLKLFNN